MPFLMTGFNSAKSRLDYGLDDKNVLTALLHIFFERFDLQNKFSVFLVIFADLFDQKLDYLVKFVLHFFLLFLNAINHHPHLVDLIIIII